MKNFRKIVCVMLSAAMLACALSSCGSGQPNDVPDGYIIASDDVNLYRLYVPSTWTVVLDTGVTSAKAPASASDDQANISVVSFNLLKNEVGVTDADSYWEYYMTEHEKVFGAPVITEDVTDFYIGTENEGGGYSARKHVFTAEVGSNTYEFMQVICMHSNWIFIITYTAKPKYFEEHLDNVNKILGVFRFTD